MPASSVRFLRIIRTQQRTLGHDDRRQGIIAANPEAEEEAEEDERP